MTIQEYQHEAARTVNHALKKEKQLAVLALGVTGEGGEIADIVKKHLGQGHPLDEDHLRVEIGDCMWYLTNLVGLMGWDMGNILQENIDKLKVRYPDGFDADRSINRNERL